MPGQRFAFLCSLVVLVLVILLVRNRRLSEKLSLFWLGFAALMMVGTSSIGFPHYLKLAALIGVVNPPSALFLLALLFLLMYTLYLSISISGLNEQNKLLAQELAMLRLEVESGKTGSINRL